MILKIELARLWGDGTWNTDWVEIDAENPQPPYEEHLLDNSIDDNLVICDRVAWAYAEAIPGEKPIHVAMVYYEWVESDEEVETRRLGQQIYAGGNLVESDRQTLKLMSQKDEGENEDDE